MPRTDIDFVPRTDIVFVPRTDIDFVPRTDIVFVPRTKTGSQHRAVVRAGHEDGLSTGQLSVRGTKTMLSVVRQ